MNHKKMRKALRDAGHSVPRSNADVEAAYAAVPEFKQSDANIATEANTPVNDAPVSNDDIYTYVGSGDEPPGMIKFRGEQVFVRGKPTKVRPDLIEFVERNSSFVKGTADEAVMYENDEQARQAAEAQRQKDRETQRAEERRNKK